MEYEQLIIGAARIVEASGVSVLIFGAVIAAAAFAWRISHGHDFRDAYHGLRVNLGRAILLGLELLVISDIIGTVAVKPTFQNLGVLACIVAIRTLLSFTLELEVSGRWPWQREERETGTGDQ